MWALGVKRMVKLYSKYLLWFGIASSVALLAYQVPAIYRAGSLFVELPFIVISLFILCSPYFFMLFRLSSLPDLTSLTLNFAIFTVLISLSGVALLFVLIYISPDAQNGIAIFILVIFQWLAIGISALVSSILNRKHYTKST